MLRLVVATSLLVLVAGCTDPEPKEPKPTTSTPTATAPTMPAQAKENTPEGAAAFVNHYIKVLNYASNTGEVEELTSISSSDCKGCRSYIDLYRETYANGGYFKDSDWTLGDLDVRFSNKIATVFATVTSPPGTYAETSQSTPQPGNPTDADLTFVAGMKSGVWKLETLELQAGS